MTQQSSKNIKIESYMTLRKMLGDTNNRIEIPIIQRDYAQGRYNAKEIRDDFLRDIFIHLNNNKSMKLSFVYGTTSGGIYVPYDGQQRLTLVYLLTLFLAAYCQNWEELKRLSRFKYYTRDQATAFCNFLTGFDVEFGNDKNNLFQRIDIIGKNIKDEIENDSAFFGSWKYEPTVSSMLVVLKSIQEGFKDITCSLSVSEKKEKAAEFLSKINDGALFFDWCSIQASDNIYIKMNGRGKPLSAFDNFKNTLYSELNKLRKKEQESGNTAKVDFLKYFEVKMDGIWTDLFWKKREYISDSTDNYDIAPYMMNFLYYIFEFRHTVNSNSFFFGGKESFRWIDEKNVVTFLSKFKDLCDVNAAERKGRITIDDYIWLSKIMDIISSRLLNNIDLTLGIDDYDNELQLLKELSNHIGKIGSTKTVIVASLYYEYLVNASEFNSNGEYVKTNDEYRSQWIEFIKRLVKTASRFKARYDALLRDKHMLSGFVNIFIPLAFKDNPCGDFLVSANRFDEKMEELKQYFDVSHVYSQLVEEIEKNKLKSIDQEKWGNAIEKAETTLPYFENMIFFLIKLSQNENGEADVEEFMKYYDIIKEVVDENGIKEQNYFSAIMLSFADYRISYGEGYSNSHSLCSNTSDAFNWRYFFDVIEGNITDENHTKLYVLKATLDLIFEKGNIKDAHDYIKNSINPDDISWSSVVIRYPEVLKMGSRHRIVDFDGMNWYLIKSDGVVKQVHSNSLDESTNLELFGLYKSSRNCDKLSFDASKIIIDNNNERYITKMESYRIHDANGDRDVNYSEALSYLNEIKVV